MSVTVLPKPAAESPGGRLAQRVPGAVVRYGPALALSVMGVLAARRRRTGRALRAAEERFRLAALNCGDLIYEWNVRTDALEWFGDAEAALGHAPGGFGPLREVWRHALHADDRERVEAAVARHLSAREPFAEEYRIGRADGSWARWIDRGTAVWDHRGRPQRLVGAVTDVTERRAAEERARASERMDAIGKVAGGVAHEVNNMMTVILGFSDLLAESAGEGGHDQEEVREIRRAAERAASITQQLLAYSRQQVLVPAPLELDEVLAGLGPLIRRTAGAKVEVELRLGRAKGGAIEADRRQLEQGILNLVLNARDAMPEGGRLTIETDRVELDEGDTRRHPSAEIRPGSYARLAVSDTGLGMDAETLSRAFDPFFTTKPVGRGTGLGLSTVYGIVKQHGGYIWPYSEPGLGTVFKVYLPLVAAPEPPADTPAPASEVPRGNETVLVIEDEPGVRTATQRLLRRLGYHVLAVGEGSAALALLEAGDAPIRLVLSDVITPGMPARELARRIGETRPGLPLVYMSGYTDEEVARRGLVEARVAFLQKPFTSAALARAVRKALDG